MTKEEEEEEEEEEKEHATNGNAVQMVESKRIDTGKGYRDREQDREQGVQQTSGFAKRYEYPY